MALRKYMGGECINQGEENMFKKELAREGKFEFNVKLSQFRLPKEHFENKNNSFLAKVDCKKKNRVGFQ